MTILFANDDIREGDRCPGCGKGKVDLIGRDALHHELE